MRAGLGRELGQDVITFYVKPDYLQAFTHRSCSLRTTHGTHQEKTHPIVMPPQNPPPTVVSFTSGRWLADLAEGRDL